MIFAIIIFAIGASIEKTYTNDKSKSVKEKKKIATIQAITETLAVGCIYCFSPDGKEIAPKIVGVCMYGLITILVRRSRIKNADKLMKEFKERLASGDETYMRYQDTIRKMIENGKSTGDINCFIRKEEQRRTDRMEKENKYSKNMLEK